MLANGRAAASVLGSGDLSYHQGPVQESPVSFILFWGPSWNNGTGGLTPDAQIVQNYFTDLSGTLFENILAQYYDSNTNIPNTHNLAGVWNDTQAPPSDTSCGGQPTIHDSAIQQEVQHAMSFHGWPRVANATYYVYTPTGYYVNDDQTTNNCSEQLTSFCAYHGWSSSVGVAYATLPYPISASVCRPLPSSPNGNSYGDSLASMTSHEQFESITDPQPYTGWADSASPPLEIGDKCLWDFSAGSTTLNNGGVFELQTEYSNATHSCVNALHAAEFSFYPHAISLTTPIGGNPASTFLDVANTGYDPLSWTITSTLPAWLSMSATSGTVNAGTGYFGIKLTFTTVSLVPRTFETTLVFTASNTVNSPFSIPVTVAVGTVSRQWYFAEGFTGGSFSEYLTLANPGQTTANVQVTYLFTSGSPTTVKYQVAAQSRDTVNVNTAVGAGKNVSMVVNSDQPIVAERPMYFTYKGLAGYTIPGGTDVLGATQLGTTYDFGYLDTTAGHDTWLTILNANASPMTATIQYFAASGGSPTTVTHTINANTRGTVHVNSEGLPSGTYSAVAQLSEPGLVERPMYLVDGTTHYTGAADVVGVAQPLAAWYFAEGYTGPTFSERYLLSNVSTSTTANATVTFFRPDGTTATDSVTIPAGGQQVIDAGSILGSRVNNSTKVTSDIPILAERFMSFDYAGPVGAGGAGNIPGATDVLGAAAPSPVFYFAEGYTGGQFAEYLTIENPDPTATATVSITFLPSTAAPPTVQVYSVGPSSRFTLFVNKVMPSTSVSAIVGSTLPIVVERPMYFNYKSGQTGGSDVVGYQTEPHGWNVVYAPGQSAGQGSFYGVAAISSNDVWAVGDYPGTSGVEPLTQHWDGTAWTFVSGPAGPLTNCYLHGASALATNDVWAVGYCTDHTGTIQTLAEHWDGVQWTIIPTPVVQLNPSAVPVYAFQAVFAVSASDVWAVGEAAYGPGGTYREVNLTEHWDGTSWSVVPSVDQNAWYASAFLGVTAVSSRDVWAVGSYSVLNSGSFTLTEHWDGTQWSTVSSPSVGGVSTFLNVVTSIASNDVWAVGDTIDYNTGQGLTVMEHWDGTQWTLVSSPSDGGTIEDYIGGVTAVSSTDVWAVGFSANGNGTGTAACLILHWDGTQWSVAPNPGVGGLYSAAAVSSQDIWAVGTNGGPTLVAEHYS